MAKRKIWFGMLVIVLVFGVAVIGCDTGNGNGSASNPFIGTWTGYDPDFERIRVVVGNSTWTVSWPDHPTWVIAGIYTNSGTYTYTGNNATLFVEGIAIGTGTVSGNTLTLIFTGVGTMVLTRQ